MADLRPITDTSAQADAIKTLWTKASEKFAGRTERITYSRQMLMGELKPSIPAEFTIENKENYRSRLPHGTTVPLKTVNVLQRKRPKVKRNVIGAGPRAEQRATKIENWTNAVLDQLLDWDTAVDWLFNEAEVGIAVLPTRAGWEKVPSYLEVIDGEETPRIRPMYQRDSSGRSRSDKFYQNRKGRERKRNYEVDEEMSSQAYEEILEDYRARNLPWTIEVLNALDIAPIFSGKKLEAAVVRKQFKRNELIRRGFNWTDEQSLLEQIQAGNALIQPDVTLYAYYGYNDDYQPFVAYSVDGKKTTWRNQDLRPGEEEADAIINLYEEFNLSRLPVCYEYGWHFASQDPDKRGVPFVWPFIPSLLGADALASATILHAWWTAFGGWFIQADPNLDPRLFLENGKPRTFEMKPMKAQVVPGLPVPAAHSGVGQDVHRMIALMMGGVSQEMPGGSGAAFGGGGATSGHDRSLMRDYLEDSVSQVLKGAVRIYEFSASIILELACGITEEEGVGIPVYRNVSVGPALGIDQKPNKTKAVQELLTLDPGDVGINYDVQGYYPRLPGENLVLAAQLAQFVKQKLATFEEFRQIAFGDESPEETRILIAVDEMIFETEVGRNYVMQLAFEYMGEDKQAEMAKLIEQNLMTKNGMPTALIQGIFPDAQVGSIQPGGGQPGQVVQGAPSGISSVTQAAGGINAGGMESASVQRDAMRSAMAGSGQAGMMTR